MPLLPSLPLSRCFSSPQAAAPCRQGSGCRVDEAAVAEETEVLRASRPRRVSTAANRGGAPARREGTCSASALWRKDPPLLRLRVVARAKAVASRRAGADLDGARDGGSSPAAALPLRLYAGPGLWRGGVPPRRSRSRRRWRSPWMEAPAPFVPRSAVAR
jgi:hypothetical protein